MNGIEALEKELRLLKGEGKEEPTPSTRIELTETNQEG